MSGPHSTGELIIIRSARDVTYLVNPGIAKGGNARAITFIAFGGIFIAAYDLSAIAFGLHDTARTYQLGAVGEGIVACSIIGMTLAILSYPTLLRGVGSGFSQALLRIGSTVALLFFPIVDARLGTDVYLVVVLVPALGLLTLILCRWEPTGSDVDDDPAPQTNSSNSSATTDAVGATRSVTTGGPPAGRPLSKEMQ